MNIFKKSFLSLVKKLKFLPPEIYAKIYYEYYYGKKLNLDNPIGFNEKIQWLKVYYHPSILNKLVDKYEVREYVKEKIGGQYLNELFYLYRKVSEIDFDQLPDKFVLKTTHGYHNNIIVKDKSTMDRRKAKLKLTKWMLKNQYYRGGQEWAYKNVPHRIIAEKYIPEIDDNLVSDYKFFCFNGKPRFVEVVVLVDGKESRRYYDTNWKVLPFNRNQISKFSDEIPVPEGFLEMVQLSEKLAGKFPFVRVDLYNVAGRIIFGELTFYPADGRYPFTPQKWNKKIGAMMRLPEIPKEKKEITEI